MSEYVSKVKREILKRYVTGKVVLDVGCIGNDIDINNFEKSLHAFIRKIAKKVIGLDIQKDKIEKLKKMGYNIIYADAQNFQLDEKFDVIFAGELIEHLDCPGKFLENAVKHLKDGGYIIITTPNPFCLKHVIGAITNRQNYVCDEHVAWFDITVLKNLAERYNLEIVDVYYIPEDPFYKPSIKMLIIHIVSRFIYLFSKRFGGEHAVYILRKNIQSKKLST